MNSTALPNVNEWPLRLPMTKSAVKAFDTITEFMEPRGQNVSSFYVVRMLCGMSSRIRLTWCAPLLAE